MKKIPKALLCILLICGHAGADKRASSDSSNLFEMSLEDLMNIPIVSASQQEQKLSEALLLRALSLIQAMHSFTALRQRLRRGIFEKSTFSAWYAYNNLDLEHHAQVIRSFNPARHKAGLTYRWFIDKNWVFNTNYSYMCISEASEMSSTGPAQFSPFNKTQTLKPLI